MELFDKLKKEFSTSVMLISHDISLILQWCDYIGVMYAGELVEFATSKEIVENPKHPYTQALLKAVPNIEEEIHTLYSIPGSPPDLSNPPKGCRFHPRCPYVMDICRSTSPKEKTENGHLVRCWLYE